MSLLPNDLTFATVNGPLFQPEALPTGRFVWPASTITTAVTVPGLTPSSIVFANIAKDDTTTPQTYWLVSTTPSTNTLLVNLAAAPPVPTTLTVDWMVRQ